MRQYLVSIAVLLCATVGYAGYQEYNGSTDLKIFDKTCLFFFDRKAHVSKCIKKDQSKEALRHEVASY